jgi:hypothetical protein
VLLFYCQASYIGLIVRIRKERRKIRESASGRKDARLLLGILPVSTIDCADDSLQAQKALTATGCGLAQSFAKGLSKTPLLSILKRARAREHPKPWVANTI